METGFRAPFFRFEDDRVLIAEAGQDKPVEVKYEDMEDVWQNHGTLKNSSGKSIRARTALFVVGAILGGALVIHAISVNKKKTPGTTF